MHISSVSDFVADTVNSDIKDLTCEGKCSRCGNCCSNFIPLMDSDISRIRRYVKKHNIKPHRILAPTAQLLIDATCPFLDTTKSDNKCKIYHIRPYICKRFSCADEGNIFNYLNDKTLMNNEFHVVDMRNTFFQITSVSLSYIFFLRWRCLYD